MSKSTITLGINIVRDLIREKFFPGLEVDDEDADLTFAIIDEKDNPHGGDLEELSDAWKLRLREDSGLLFALQLRNTRSKRD